MMRGVGLAILIVAKTMTPAEAQMTAVEVTQSAGVSSESITGAGTQVRALGEIVRGLRFDVEGVWADRSGAGSGEASDAFGTAYPYAGDVQIMEAYAEYFMPQRWGIRSVRAGRYRTPFGISSAADHAYVGFLRPPLIRYGGYFAIANTYLEHGVDVVVGAPQLSVEASVGRPGDVGEAIRRPGTNAVVRAQAASGDLIVGVSYIDTNPYQPERFAQGRARFGGVDARWMSHGVQVRGEWLGGKPFDGTETTGGYVDLIVHRPAMGPVTLLARAERLDYDASPPHALYTHRYSAGARVRVWQFVAVSAAVVHQPGQQTQRYRTAFDMGVTASLRRGF
jgi:hypothetical protein